MDTDNDGMDDDWEQETFGGLNISNGIGDADGDGLSDFDEFRLGSTAISVDSDNDGMPDAWETANQLHSDQDDSMDDPDADLVPNIAEYYAGTDPNDGLDLPSAKPSIEDFETGNLAKFQWNTTGTKSWEVSSKSALDGAFSINSPLLNNTEWAQFETSVMCKEGAIRFTYIPISYACNNNQCDRFLFLIDGIEIESFYDKAGQNIAIYPVSAGKHTCAWKYTKGSDVTTSNAKVSIDNIIFPTYPLGLPVKIPGDLSRDGDIDLLDVMIGLRMLSGISSSNEPNLTGADVNGDGVINMIEVIYVMQKYSESH